MLQHDVMNRLLLLLDKDGVWLQTVRVGIGVHSSWRPVCFRRAFASKMGKEFHATTNYTLQHVGLFFRYFLCKPNVRISAQHRHDKQRTLLRVATAAIPAATTTAAMAKPAALDLRFGVGTLE